VEEFVIKLDIVNAVVSKTGVTRTKAEQAVETVFEAMKTALGKGERIELRRFGVFNVRPRKTGIGRNPRTGQEVSILRAKRCASSLAKNYNRCKPNFTEAHFLPARIAFSLCGFALPDFRSRSRAEAFWYEFIVPAPRMEHPIFHDR
jgi:nucleoid DNA-binding protein